MNKLIYIGWFLAIVACKNTKPEHVQKPEIYDPPNVLVLKDAFTLTKLNRNRTVRIYLPPNYGVDQTKKYPVLYMHDAQNLFEDSTSYAGEWCVDEVMDSLSKGNGLDLIVIGIDHGEEKRLEELSPWVNETHGGGEGDAYLDFIINDLKPFVDKNFRTLESPEHTGIMGASMGGLLSHYAVFKYPKVFGKAGIYSPSYWFAEQEVFGFTENHKIPETTKMSILIGEKEGEDMVPYAKKMVNQIKETHPNIRFTKDPQGEHNEKLWRKHFAETVVWLFD